MWQALLHTGIKHEHSPGVVATHQCFYIGIITPINLDMLVGGEVERDNLLHVVFRSVFGAVVWVVLTRAEFASVVQTVRRRALRVWHQQLS